MQRFIQYLEERSSDVWLKAKVSKIIHRKMYTDALQTLKTLVNRKEKEAGDPKRIKHGIEYYAAQIARSYPGVDARELAKMFNEMNEQYGDMDRGTPSLTKKYMKDTPYQPIDNEIVKAKDGSYTYKGKSNA